MRPSIRHALVQRTVGFYSVYLPPDYDGDEQRTYPACFLLHGMGGRDTDFAVAVLESLGRHDVIYIAPRAPHRDEQGGYRAWPTPWSDWQKEDFPREDVEAAEVPALYTNWIARCLEDARSRYRISPARVSVFGHSEGAVFAHRFAFDHPTLVAAYFAHAGYYDYATDGSAARFEKHNVFSLIAHCRDDPAQKFEGAQALIDHFRKHKLAHATLLPDEGGHGLTPEILDAARKFVDRWCREGKG